MTLLNYLGAACFLIGAAFLLVAAIGVLRMPGLFERMHAAAKPQWLGVFFAAAGTVLVTRSWQWLAVGVVMVVLQTVSAPIGTHLLARSAYRVHHEELEGLAYDDLARDTRAASAAVGNVTKTGKHPKGES